MGEAISILASQTGRLPSEILAYYREKGVERLMVDLRLMARGVELHRAGQRDTSTAEGQYNSMREKMGGDYEERKRKLAGYG